MMEAKRTPLEICMEATRMSKAIDGDGPLTAGQREAIRNELRELMATDDRLNARVIARQLGCARSTATQIVNDTYKGDVDRYLRAAGRWMRDRAQRAGAPQADYVRTGVGDAVMAVCKRAADAPCIGQVVTPSGAGKTAALMEFARRRGDRAIYFQAGQCYSTKGGLVMELARRLGISLTTRSTSASLYMEIRDRLADYYAGGKGDPFVILVDEATSLQSAALNTLRNLHDDPSCRTAVVLADTARLSRELTGRNGWAMYEQLRSRCGAVFAMAVDEEISPADVKAVADSTLAGLGHKGRPAAASYKYLHKLAQGDGKLRNVVYRLHAVAYVAEQAKGRADYSVAQLDFVADLVGAACQLEWDGRPAPFGRRQGKSAKAVA